MSKKTSFFAHFRSLVNNCYVSAQMQTITPNFRIFIYMMFFNLLASYFEYNSLVMKQYLLNRFSHFRKKNIENQLSTALLCKYNVIHYNRAILRYHTCTFELG